MRTLIGRIAACVGVTCLVCVAGAQPIGLGQDRPKSEQDQGWQQGPRGGRRGPGRGHHRPGPPPLMTVLDVDKNGELSAEEIANAATVLLTLDANSDGKLTRDEIRPKRGEGREQAGFGGRGKGPHRGPGGEQFVERIMSFDKDGDGKVTKEELPGGAQRLLERGDTNGDGALDREELQKLSEEFGQRRGGPGRGPKRGRPADETSRNQ